jgi:hypothetical protein
MKRLGRLRFGVYVVLTLLVLLGGARLLLSSAYAAEKVAGRLAAALGVPVHVKGVDIALGGDSSLQGLHIYEADGERPGDAWIRADDVRADLSAVDLFADDPMPRQVVLAGARVELRFTDDGALLTRLPKTDPSRPMPKLRLENAQLTVLTVKQDGRGHRPPLTVNGVNAEFSSADGTFRFEGTCADTKWGEWTVRGSYDSASDLFRLALHSDRAEVTDEKLNQLPFIPKDVWTEVQIDKGLTPVDFEMTARGEEPAKYRVDLKPRNTKVRVSCIDLDAEQVSGDVLVEDGVVTLRNVTGRTANGTISTEAVLDFRGEDSHLLFSSIRVEKVELHRLPESWKLKENEIHGKLSGEARLDVLVKAAGVDMTGSGHGVVNEGIFKNLPIFAPIKLKLSAAKDKIQITPAGTGLIPGL